MKVWDNIEWADCQDLASCLVWGMVDKEEEKAWFPHFIWGILWMMEPLAGLKIYGRRQSKFGEWVIERFVFKYVIFEVSMEHVFCSGAYWILVWLWLFGMTLQKHCSLGVRILFLNLPANVDKALEVLLYFLSVMFRAWWWEHTS